MITEPDKIKLPHGFLQVYEHVYFNKQKELLGNKEYQIKSAIERGGGKYISFTDLNNKENNVSFDVGGKSR